LEEGIRQVHQAVEGITATGADMGMNGEANEGLTLLEKAFGIIAKSGSKYQLPELLRTKGELLSRLARRHCWEVVSKVSDDGPH
jgi:hypothetical protein